MSDVIEFPVSALCGAQSAIAVLADFGINVSVMIGRPGGAWCGATILFDLSDFDAEAGLTGDPMGLMKRTRNRFYADEAFRAEMSRECFSLGSLLQGWGEPRPPLNF